MVSMAIKMMCHMNYVTGYLNTKYGEATSACSFVSLSPISTIFSMLVHNDTSMCHINLVGMETILAGNYVLPQLITKYYIIKCAGSVLIQGVQIVKLQSSAFS